MVPIFVGALGIVDKKETMGPELVEVVDNMESEIGMEIEAIDSMVVERDFVVLEVVESRVADF